MLNKKALMVRAAVAAVVGGASVGAFAQTTPTTTFDTTQIVASINGVAPAIIAVGAAVLGVVAVAWGIKMVRSFIGR
jgi:hypothetical protein